MRIILTGSSSSRSCSNNEGIRLSKKPFMGSQVLNPCKADIQNVWPCNALFMNQEGGEA